MVLLVTLRPPPCLLFEDDDLLVVNKPPGINTHAPAPYHNEGLYDWLRHRQPRWAQLGLLQRLDKDTSGVLLFTKSDRANRSIARQFADRTVQKRYRLLTDHPVPSAPQHIRTALVRAGQYYRSRPPHRGADTAETRFQLLSRQGGRSLVEALPVTGRSHQIRVHAADLGFPILGDIHYGGSPAQRLCLHAQLLTIQHPATGQSITFTADPDFSADPLQELRRALFEPSETNAFRLIHGAANGHPGWYVDRLGDHLLSQSEFPIHSSQQDRLRQLRADYSCAAAFHKTLARQPTSVDRDSGSPEPIFGDPPAERFVIVENGVRFHLSVQEGYSVGLFLDQRDNRRRLLTGHVAPGFTLPYPGPTRARVLNAFAYTCGFSLCAALAGAHTTSIDLSGKYLAWGQSNFTLNGLDPDSHSFLRGDVFSWFRRLARQHCAFDLILLDPPTFSRSKESGVFRAETDYAKLVVSALPLLRSGGILFASTNAAQLGPQFFLDRVTAAIRDSGRSVRQQQFAPQPPDFPISRNEPAHLKTVWIRIQ